VLGRDLPTPATTLLLYTSTTHRTVQYSGSVWPLFSHRRMLFSEPLPSSPLLAQSRQSAKLFLLSSELGLPQPLARRRVRTPTFGSGGRGTLAGERGGGRVPVPTRGYTLWYSVNIRTLCLLHILV
jgi:hypothetical protein